MSLHDITKGVFVQNTRIEKNNPTAQALKTTFQLCDFFFSQQYGPPSGSAGDYIHLQEIQHLLPSGELFQSRIELRLFGKNN